MRSKKKNIPWSFRQLLAKGCLTFFTIIVGMYCGVTTSSSAFYIAVLIQACNNVYESYGLLEGYNKLVTTFHTISFIGALISAMLAILFFAGAHLTHWGIMLGVSIALVIPAAHFLFEAYILWNSGKY